MPVWLYHTWLERLGQLHTGERITVLRNFAWLLVGLYASGSVHLSKVADELPSSAKLPSVTRRLTRLLANPAVRVRTWYEPLARRLLAEQGKSTGEIRLIVDGSKIGFHHQLLIVSLAFRRRALPIAWTWIPHERGHSSVSAQVALMAYVHKLLPQDVPVLLVGDTEFGHVPLLRQLEIWGWHYVLRQKSDYLVQLPQRPAPLPFGFFARQAGQSEWLGKGWLTNQHRFPVHLLVHWQMGEKQPWLLATNLPDKRRALAAYRRRMWVEEMFGDFKKHGFDLEATHLCHFSRLSRLTLAVALLYVWLIHVGATTIKQGLRHCVDRHDRRDLSLFRIGRSYIKRCLKSDSPPPNAFLPLSQWKLSGG